MVISCRGPSALGPHRSPTSDFSAGRFDRSQTGRSSANQLVPSERGSARSSRGGRPSASERCEAPDAPGALHGGSRSTTRQSAGPPRLPRNCARSATRDRGGALDHPGSADLRLAAALSRESWGPMPSVCPGMDSAFAGGIPKRPPRRRAVDFATEQRSRRRSCAPVTHRGERQLKRASVMVLRTKSPGAEVARIPWRC